MLYNKVCFDSSKYGWFVKEKNLSLRQCGCPTYAGVGNMPDNKEMGKYICKEFFIVFDDVFSRKLSFIGSL